MGKINWTKINYEDVIEAIEIFNRDNPEYPDPKVTFLIYEGKKLPAKHIRGMAYKVAYGREIKKSEYSGGMETVRFLKDWDLKFTILEKHLEKKRNLC